MLGNNHPDMCYQDEDESAWEWQGREEGELRDDDQPGNRPPSDNDQMM